MIALMLEETIKCCRQKLLYYTNCPSSMLYNLQLVFGPYFCKIVRLDISRNIF